MGWPFGVGAANGRPFLCCAGALPLLIGAAPLCRDPLRAARAIVKRMWRPRGEAGRAALPLGHRLRLDPVLAEGGEVDHQIGGIENVLAND
jgi:hypothetical protein